MGVNASGLRRCPLAAGKAGRKKLLLCAMLFFFWVALSSSLALHDMVLGAVCSALAAALAALLLGRALDPRITPAVLLRLPAFALALAWKILKANLDLAGIVVSPRLPVDPGMVEYRTFLAGDLPRTVFADSITLTPGTLTVELEGDLLRVHCLCPRHARGLPPLERLVAWLFGVRAEPPASGDRPAEGERGGAGDGGTASAGGE